MPREKSPGALKRIRLIAFLTRQFQREYRSGHFGRVVLIGRMIRDAEKDLKGQSRAEAN